MADKKKQREILKAGIDRVANKLALPLETLFARAADIKSDDEYAEGLKRTLNTDVPKYIQEGEHEGVLELLYGLERELKGMAKQFFPDDAYKSWPADDDCLAGIHSSACLVSLILRSGLEDTNFIKVSNRAMLGLVEQLHDVYQRLVDLSAKLETNPIAKPKAAA